MVVRTQTTQAFVGVCNMSIGARGRCGRVLNQGRFDPRVYLVTDRRVSAGRTVEEIVEAAIRGDGNGRGVTFVQLRDKNIEREQSVQLGQKLRRITRELGVGFVVNDDAELAAELGADGVHVGQDDMDVERAREWVGPDGIVGVSAGDEQEALRAIEQGADYLGVGAVFRTSTKGDAGTPIGVDGLRRVVSIAKRARVPVVAIGGIDPRNAPACWKAGADGVAVVSAVMASPTAQQAAETAALLAAGCPLGAARDD